VSPNTGAEPPVEVPEVRELLRSAEATARSGVEMPPADEFERAGLDPLGSPADRPRAEVDHPFSPWRQGTAPL
jgi:hypothetical protein